MHSYSSPSLEEEYLKWSRNKRILDEILRDNTSKDSERSQWKAAMENALMYAVFRQTTYDPDLMAQLDSKAIEHGFNCVSLDESHAKIERLRDFIIKTVESYRDKGIEPLNPKINPTQLAVDDYKLKRNSYINKAYQFLVVNNGEEKALRILLTASLRYSSIYAETRHIGPPQSVYDAFYDWGIRNEGFASPFNARLLGKENAQFYSLFPDTDAPFGSGGSFFWLNEPKNDGHWSLDPPFLSETMDKVDTRIREWRAKYPEVSILYIIPESHIPAVTPDETVLLQSGIHHYEGLDGAKHPLPVNVCIHRYGTISDFDANVIIEGYGK